MNATRKKVDTVGDPEQVRFRTIKREAMFTLTIGTGKEKRLRCWRAKGHVLELKPADEHDDKLINYLRNHRGNGTDFRELVNGDSGTNLTDDGATLDRLMTMDMTAIWAMFEPFELESLGLDPTSTKNELIAAFLKLRKRIPL